MRRVSILPSLLTVGNFTCGFLAVVLCLQSVRAEALAAGRGAAAPAVAAPAEAFQTVRGAELLRGACYLLFLAMLFDMLDGRVARMTGGESRFGAELDSLADVCSFGFAPAAIVTTLWIEVQPPGAAWWGQVMVCGAAYAACAALRLARYNVESGTADKGTFSGLPSPAAAACVASTVLFCLEGHLARVWGWLADRIPAQEELALQARGLGLYMLVIGLLMVTRLRFAHMTNRYLGGRRRFTSLVVILFLVVLLVERPAEVLFALGNGYVALSLIANLRRRARPGACGAGEAA